MDCPYLDVSGDFIKNGITFTDLNSDGAIEVTVSYQLNCTGAIEPSKIKTILRDGKTKFAIRGESLVIPVGHEPFGGERTLDKELLKPSNGLYRKHLESVWDRIYIKKMR
ncbi:hypothetical protein GCM10027277_11070 [Pseudoduganella ginsengisoli]|uniref:Uncharacterized protein n=1 Tax=Pseudoduganella ginsengisoli TaxID=1462440 RepID=A0A6L6PVD3_9BURK|nr:hypothetical protein [Pseudoduganella ginsengisoli]MTW01503.1 hypothetical protein [Pseudoduganella ginsengisoli]